MRERGVKIACGKVPAAEQHRTPQPKMKQSVYREREREREERVNCGPMVWFIHSQCYRWYGGGGGHPPPPSPTSLAWISRLLSQFTRRKLGRHTHGHHLPLVHTVRFYLRSAILIQDLIHHPQPPDIHSNIFQIKNIFSRHLIRMLS